MVKNMVRPQLAILSLFTGMAEAKKSTVNFNEMTIKRSSLPAGFSLFPRLTGKHVFRIPVAGTY